MRAYRCLLFVVLAVALSAGVVVPCRADEATWKLGPHDDFERAVLGEGWKVDGSAAVSEGALRLSGTAEAILEAAIGRDQRLEFRLRVLAGRGGARMHSSAGASYTWLLAANGGAHRLVGPGLELEADMPRLSPQQQYRCRFQREGRCFTCLVDDVAVFDATLEKVIMPDGIQRAALVSEGEALFDQLRVFNRSPAHPDCCPPPLEPLPLQRRGDHVVAGEGVDAPGLAEALAALNAGDFEQARARFEALEDVTLRLAGLAYLLGDINYFERPAYGRYEPSDTSTLLVEEDYGELGAFAERWREEAARHPDNKTLQDYLPWVEKFGRLAFDRACRKTAKELAEFDQRINPFADKATLYHARCVYWDSMEASSPTMREPAIAQLKGLLARYPDNRVLNEYVGAPVPWGEELNAATDAHPVWAAYLREAYARELAILERFVDLRQTPDGQLGGGWGDDVEMMRSWVPIAAISTCAGKLRQAIAKLAEGIWNHRCIDGYDGVVADVEHSAEPTADTFPAMLLLEYGDPRWHQYNLRAAKTIKERFMALDDKGYPRFLSGVFGSLGVAMHDRSGFDTGYHARAMRHFYWPAWHGNVEARDWFLRWVDGWYAATMDDAPDKPAGLPPGTLFFPSGDYRPPDGSPWYREAWHHLYGAGGLPAMTHDTFMQAYSLTRDRRYLRPFEYLMDGATRGPLPRGNVADDPGSPQHLHMMMAHTTNANLGALYRLFTGERVYDEYIPRFGSATQIYQVDRDLERYIRGIQQAAVSLRVNLWYHTSEVMATDRLHLPAVDEVWGAYTGAVTGLGDAQAASLAASYDTPSSDFAALVVDQTHARLRVWLYSFWEQPTEIGLHLWRLDPGEYILSQGPRLPGEFPFQSRYGWAEPRRVRLLHRGEAVRVTVPPGEEYVVDLRLDKPIERPPRLADLAVHAREIKVEDHVLTVAVHNIGSASAAEVPIVVEREADGDWEIISRRRIDHLAAVADFTPHQVTVTFPVRRERLHGRCRVVVDPDGELDELCKANNTAWVPPQSAPR